MGISRGYYQYLSLEAESVAEAGQGVVSGTAVVGPQVTHSRDASSWTISMQITIYNKMDYYTIDLDDI